MLGNFFMRIDGIFLQSIWFSFACNSALHLGKNQHMIIVSSLWLVNILFICVPMCLCSIYHHVGGVVSQGGMACNSIFAIPPQFWLLFVHFTRLFMVPVSFCHCGRENLASQQQQQQQSQVLPYKPQKDYKVLKVVATTCKQRCAL